jgi:WD40 repeat protein
MWIVLWTLAGAADLAPRWSSESPPMAPVGPYSVAWSGPTEVLVGGGGYASRWSFQGEVWRAPYPVGYVRAVAPARQGRWAVIGADDGSVVVRSLDDGRIVRTLQAPGHPGQRASEPGNWVGAVAVSPRDDLAAAGMLLTGELAIWTLPDGVRLPLGLPFPDHHDRAQPRTPPWGQDPRRIESLAFHPNGRLLYIAGLFGAGIPLVVLDLETGKTATWRAHLPQASSHGQSVAVSPDGGLVALASWGGSLEVRRQDGEIVWARVLSERGWAGPVAFTPDGAHLGVATPEALWILDPATGASVAHREVSATGVAIHPDGSQIATVHHRESRVRRFRLPDLTPLDDPRGPFAAADQLSVSPDGTTLAVASSGGPGVRLFDRATGAQTASLPDQACVGWGGIKWSPTGELLAVHDCNYDRGIWVLHARSLQPASSASFPTNGEGWWTGDGAHLVVMDAFAYDNPRLYHVASGRAVEAANPHIAPYLKPVEPKNPGYVPPTNVALALWGARSVLPTHWINQHIPAAFAPAPGDGHGGFSRDLRTTAGVRGNTLTVYRDAAPIAEHTFERPVAGAAVTPDGRAVAVGFADGSVRMVDIVE